MRSSPLALMEIDDVIVVSAQSLNCKQIEYHENNTRMRRKTTRQCRTLTAREAQTILLILFFRIWPGLARRAESSLRAASLRRERRRRAKEVASLSEKLARQKALIKALRKKVVAARS